MRRAGLEPRTWLRRPLCRRYVLGVFNTSIVRLRNDDKTLTARPIHWAFGCLVDGELEPLGVWASLAAESDTVQAAAADLQKRGVERIWHVTGGAGEWLLRHMTAAFSGTSVFSFDDRTIPNGAASPRRIERSAAEGAAEDAREYLVRAIRRHGGFENEATALDFVTAALQRMERRLDRDCAAKGRPRQRSGAQTVPPGF